MLSQFQVLSRKRLLGAVAVLWVSVLALPVGCKDKRQAGREAREGYEKTKEVVKEGYEKTVETTKEGLEKGKDLTEENLEKAREAAKEFKKGWDEGKK